MLKTIVLAAMALILFTGCWGREGPESWTSYIYPDKNNDKRSMASGVFPTLEECREASLAKLKELKLDKNGDYKCALDCEYHDGMKTEICREMTK